MKCAPNRHDRLPQHRIRTTLAGFATLLAALLTIWLGFGGVASMPAGGAISMERKHADASRDNNNPRAMEADSHFMERARAFEAGFKAAFLFRR